MNSSLNRNECLNPKEAGFKDLNGSTTTNLNGRKFIVPKPTPQELEQEYNTFILSTLRGVKK